MNYIQIKSLYKMHCSLIVLISIVFTCPCVVYANEINVENEQMNECPDITHPREYSYLIDSYDGNSCEYVVLIQDIHANQEAQINIANILEFYKDLNFLRNTILTEGAWTDISLNQIRKLESLDSWKDLGLTLINHLALTGEEYFNLTHKEDIQILGMEDKKLYIQNINALREMLLERSKFEHYWIKVVRKINMIKSKFYPRELLKYEKIDGQYGNKKKEYIKLKFLWDLAQENSINLSRYKNIDYFMKPSTLQSIYELDSVSLIDFDNEITALEHEVYQSILNNEMIQIHRLDRMFKFLKSAFELNLSSQEYSILKQYTDFYFPLEWQSILNSKLIEIGKIDDLVYSDDKPHYSYLKVIHFYEIAKKRDIQFEHYIQNSLKNINPNSLAIILGGFHANAITQFLTDKGISYVLLAPKTNLETNQEMYENTMIQHILTTTEKQIRFLMPFASMKNGVLSLPKGMVLHEDKFWHDKLRVLSLSTQYEVLNHRKHMLFRAHVANLLLDKRLLNTFKEEENVDVDTLNASRLSDQFSKYGEKILAYFYQIAANVLSKLGEFEKYVPQYVISSRIGKWISEWVTKIKVRGNFLYYYNHMNSKSHFQSSKYLALLKEKWRDVSSLMDNKEVLVKPRYVEIHPSQPCQLKCLNCRGDVRMKKSLLKKPEPMISMSHIIHTIHDLHLINPHIFIKISGQVGDPLLYPNIKGIFETINAHGLRWGLVTNGIEDNLRDVELLHLLSRADFVSFSVDAGTEETYSKLKTLGQGKNPFRQVLKNIQVVTEYKKKHKLDLKIIASLLLQEVNYREIPILSHLLKDIGIDMFQIKMQHYSDKRHMVESSVHDAYLIVKETQVRDSTDNYRVVAVQSEDEAIEKVRGFEKMGFTKCYANMLGLNTTIAPDGDIKPCCQYDGRILPSHGNIESGFAQAYVGSQRRSSLNVSPSTHCDSCSPSDGFVNRFVHFMVQSHAKDPTFRDWVEKHYISKLKTDDSILSEESRERLARDRNPIEFSKRRSQSQVEFIGRHRLLYGNDPHIVVKSSLALEGHARNEFPIYLSLSAIHGVTMQIHAEGKSEPRVYYSNAVHENVDDESLNFSSIESIILSSYQKDDYMQSIEMLIRSLESIGFIVPALNIYLSVPENDTKVTPILNLMFLRALSGELNHLAIKYKNSNFEKQIHSFNAFVNRMQNQLVQMDFLKSDDLPEISYEYGADNTNIADNAILNQGQEININQFENILREISNKLSYAFQSPVYVSWVGEHRLLMRDRGEDLQLIMVVEDFGTMTAESYFSNFWEAFSLLIMDSGLYTLGNYVVNHSGNIYEIFIEGAKLETRKIRISIFRSWQEAAYSHWLLQDVEFSDIPYSPAIIILSCEYYFGLPENFNLMRIDMKNMDEKRFVEKWQTRYQYWKGQIHRLKKRKWGAKSDSVERMIQRMKQSIMSARLSSMGKIYHGMNQSKFDSKFYDKIRGHVMRKNDFTDNRVFVVDSGVLGTNRFLIENDYLYQLDSLGNRKPILLLKRGNRRESIWEGGKYLNSENGSVNSDEEDDSSNFQNMIYPLQLNTSQFSAEIERSS